jgi:hypothetical protein
MTTPSIILVNGSKSANGNGAIGNVGTTGCGGARASTNTWGPLFAFNLVVEFFHELQWNYRRVRIEKLQDL